jgi:fluoroquinolone transport system permease protein
MVLGFLLIDERDEGTLAALQVTPLSLSRFYYHRVVMVMLVSTVIEVIAFYLIGAIRLTFPLLLVSALAASPLAAICGLAFARFAENKIQGFGGVKIVSVMMFLPVAASLFGSPWNLLIGVFFPPSWSFSGFVMLASDEAIGLLWLALGMAAQGAIVLVLLRSVKMG